jgi:hypothetical protein
MATTTEPRGTKPVMIPADLHRKLTIEAAKRGLRIGRLAADLLIIGFQGRGK